MSKLKKLYTYSNKRHLWRLLPTETDKIVIEERDLETNEVYFNCLEIYSGKSILKNLQLDEKIWIGIEKVYNDIIFFHKFIKPDMPGHKGIIAFDVNSQKILWENESLAFLFINDKILYSYKEIFEGRIFYSINYKTGEILEEIKDTEKINRLREEDIKNDEYKNYNFSEIYENSVYKIKMIDNFKENNIIKGPLFFLKYNDMVMLNFHQIKNNGKLKNLFKVIDINSEKYIFEETLNKETTSLIPESFFVKNNLLFLLKEKTKFIVCDIK